MVKEGLYLCFTGFQLQTRDSKIALYSNYTGAIIKTDVKPHPNSIFISTEDLGKALNALYVELTSKR